MNKSDQSESSIYRIETINRITDKNKYLTISVKINGTKKEFITDTGLPLSILPADDNVLEKTEFQKVKQRYQDGNKNQIKISGQIRQILNTKQQTENANTDHGEGLYNTIRIDRMKNITLTIGNIQLKENNQFEKSDREVPRSIQEYHHNKRCRIKHTISTWTLSGKTKSETNSITSSENW